MQSNGSGDHARLYMQNKRNATEDICCSNGTLIGVWHQDGSSAWEFGLSKAYRKSLVSQFCVGQILQAGKLFPSTTFSWLLCW